MEASGARQARRAAGGPGPAQPRERRRRPGRKLSAAAFTPQPEGLRGGGRGRPRLGPNNKHPQDPSTGDPPPAPPKSLESSGAASAGRAGSTGEEGAAGGSPRWSPALLTL